MSSIPTTLPQVAEGTGAVAKINELLDAATQTMVGARNVATSALLTWGYLGGRFNGITIANGTVTLTASTTNYIVMKKSDGVVSVSTATTNWNDTANYWRLYQVVVGATAVTSALDERSSQFGLLGVPNGSTLTNPMTTAEDLIKGGASGTPARLAPGSNGQVLTIAGGVVGWGNVSGTGDVVGPAGATADRIAVFDGATGKLLKDGGKTVAGLRAPSIQSVVSAATVTPTFSDDIVKVTAQAAALALANPTGTAIDGLGIVIRIKDNGTARAISYGTQYRAIGITLPATTVVNKTLYLACIWNADDTKLDVVAVGQEA